MLSKDELQAIRDRHVRRDHSTPWADKDELLTHIAEQEKRILDLERASVDFRQVVLVAREVLGEMPHTLRVVKARQMIETVLYVEEDGHGD